MWTSSFVLVAGGYSLALLTFAYFTIEQMNWRKGWTWPWLVFGSNAIAAYMFSELMPGILYNIHVSVGSRQAHRLHRLDLHAHLRAHPRSALGRLRLLRLVHRVLLHPGVDPLPEENLPQGVSTVLGTTFLLVRTASR